jgi:SpoVK/Ycf46/Vps4 family AAA+-type ATPase
MKTQLAFIRVDAIESALRRPGRFDSEIEVTVPTAEERFEILKVSYKNVVFPSKIVKECCIL